MAIYKYTANSNVLGTICKDGLCYEDCDTTNVNNLWRAVQWKGTSGIAELCDGTDYDVNTGEQALSAESEIQSIVDAWQAAYDAEQAEIAAAEAAAAEAAQAEA